MNHNSNAKLNMQNFCKSDLNSEQKLFSVQCVYHKCHYSSSESWLPLFNDKLMKSASVTPTTSYHHHHHHIIIITSSSSSTDVFGVA